MARQGSSRRRRAAGLTAALAAGASAVALAAPSASDAAFTLPQCGGGDLTGSGSTLQNQAQTTWSTLFGAACPQFGGNIQYRGGGSGQGRGDMALRTTNNPNNVRFAGSDTAASQSQRNTIEAGDTANPNDNGTLHEIPVTVGAVAVIVNFPDGCTLPKSSTYYDNADPTGDSADNSNTGRVKFDNATLEHIFAADPGYTSWGGATNGDIVASSGSSKTDAQCQDTPITRVVRLDSSGTTSVFKSWLATIDSSVAKNWNGRANQNWPNEPAGGDAASGANTGTTGTPAAGGGSNVLGRLVRPSTNGGVPLAGVVNDDVNNDGSIGYVDLPDAITQGFLKSPNSHSGDTSGSYSLDRTAPYGGDDTFFIRTQNGSSQYTDPTVNKLAYKGGNDNGAGAAKPGADCDQATFTDKSNAGNPAGTLPSAPSGSTDRTLANWDQVQGVNSAQGYGVCTLTYLLAFDDNAVVYGNNSTEESRARTLKDYLTMIVGSQGQTNVAAQTSAAQNYYSKLPSNILATAQQGVAAIGWNKAGVGQGSNDTGGGTTTPTSNTGSSNTTTTTPPPPVNGAPSNKFSITAARSQSNGIITLPVSVPGPGTLAAVGSTTVKTAKVSAAAKKKKTKKISYGRVTVKTSAAGTVKLKLKPSAAAKRALAKGQKLKVTIKVTFTPTGGTANTRTRTVTVKGKKKKKG